MTDKYPQITRTLLSILADFNNAITRTVSIVRLIFNSSILYSYNIARYPDVCEIDIQCLYIYIYIYIYIEHRNLETRKTIDDFLVLVRNFLLTLSLKVLRHKERDTHSFYSRFFICPYLVRYLPTGSASERKSTVFS